jgi:hypothetical protein
MVLLFSSSLSNQSWTLSHYRSSSLPPQLFLWESPPDIFLSVVAQDRHYPGDWWLPGEAARRRECTMYCSTDAGLPGILWKCEGVQLSQLYPISSPTFKGFSQLWITRDFSTGIVLSHLQVPPAVFLSQRKYYINVCWLDWLCSHTDYPKMHTAYWLYPLYFLVLCSLPSLN